MEITISGALFNKTARTMEPVVIIGEAILGDHTPPVPPIVGQPPHPSHPIPPIPAHPIVNPKPPVDPPPVDPPTNPADPAWEWGWNPNTGWVPVFVPGDKPQPPGSPQQGANPPKR